MCWVATLIEAAVFGPLVEVKPVSATANRARQQRLADRTAQTALQTCAEACVQRIDGVGKQKSFGPVAPHCWRSLPSTTVFFLTS